MTLLFVVLCTSAVLCACTATNRTAESTATAEATASAEAALAASPQSTTPTMAPTANPNLLSSVRGAFVRRWTQGLKSSSPEALAQGYAYTIPSEFDGPIELVFELPSLAHLHALSASATTAVPLHVVVAVSTDDHAYQTAGSFDVTPSATDKSGLDVNADARFLRVTFTRPRGANVSIESLQIDGALESPAPRSFDGYWQGADNASATNDSAFEGVTGSIPDEAPPKSAGYNQFATLVHEGTLVAFRCNNIDDVFHGTLDANGAQAAGGSTLHVVGPRGNVLIGKVNGSNVLALRAKTPPPLCATLRKGRGQSVLVLGRNSTAELKEGDPTVVPGFAFTDAPLPLLDRSLLDHASVAVIARVCKSTQNLADWQQRLLLSWVADGHVLVIRDADACSQSEYAFLPYPFTTKATGARGARGEVLTIADPSTLGAGASDRPHFVDTIAYLKSQGQQLGDADIMQTQDTHWCGLMFAKNVAGASGWIHAYARYGHGLIIYNGFDVDDLSSLVPQASTVSRLEYQQPPRADLPCNAKVASALALYPSADRTLPSGRAVQLAFPMTLTYDSQSTAGANIDLTVAPASASDHWPLRVTPARVALAPGRSAALRVAINVPANARGTHAFIVRANNGSQAGAQATITLNASLALAKELEKDKRARIYGIHFDVASANIAPQSEAVIGQIAQVLRQYPNWRMKIEGHTDSDGGASYNQDLSERRAHAVVHDLVSRYHIAATRLVAQGLGLSRPVASNATEAGKALNRRVAARTLVGAEGGHRMSWLARGFAIALLTVLADTVVAAFHSPASALAAVSIGTAVAIAITALFWSRPSIAAAGVLLILTATLAFASRGGVSNGPALTGISPTDTAAIVIAAALLIAAIGGFVVFTNALVRAIVVLLALYGIASTLASVGHGGLLGAFRSAPLAWTRGTYVAAEVLLPGAAAIALLYGIVQLIRRRGVNGLVAVILSFALLATAHLGAFAAGAAGLPTIVAFEHPTGVMGVDDLLEPETGPLFLPKGSNNVPPEVAAAAANLAQNPQRALESVAGLGDDLYVGALAGSVGTLRAGSANSVDKALLLRDLLRAHSPKIETRFARCTLSSQHADALVAQARSGRNGHAKILMQTADIVANNVTDSTLQDMLRRWSHKWKALVAQTQDNSKQLGAALRTTGLALPSGYPAPEALRAIAAPHVWVRAMINGSWVDFDPTIEPAATGKARCAAQSETVDLPSDLYDVLGVRIATEQRVDGVSQRNVIFDRTLRAADVGDRDVSFMFAEPVGMTGALDKAPAPPPGAIGYTPLLRVGDENVAGTPLLVPVPPAQQNAIGNAAANAANALSQIGTESPSPTPTPASVQAIPEITGAWIEFSVSSPGIEPVTVRTPIFDRVGYAARANHVVPEKLADGPRYSALSSVWNVVVSDGYVASGGGSSSNVMDGSDAPSLSHALARVNSGYYALRRSLVDDARNGTVGVVAARPGISVLAMVNGGLLMDVASEDALPLSTDEARPTWAAASVLAERAMVNADAFAATDDPTTIAGNDALAAFNHAIASGAAISALHPGDGAVQTIAVSDEARARMALALRHGDSLVAPSRDVAQGGAPTYSWWIVDPAKGTLRDENAAGQHPEAAEESITTEEVAVRSYSSWRRFACNVAGVARVAVFAIATVLGQKDVATLAKGGASAAKAAAELAEKMRRDQDALNEASKAACGGGPPK